MVAKSLLGLLVLACTTSAFPHTHQPNASTVYVQIDWNESLRTSKTATTLQVVVNPLLLDNSSIYNNALASLRTVASDHVRFVPWHPYPRLAVPEIDPPTITATTCETHWDFSWADQLMASFYSATKGVSHIINFSTTPDWMWISNETYTYPEDVTVIDFNYNNGTQLRDPTLKEISEYYARLVSWYVDGGFTDECGVYHYSGHHYDIEYWEVLNEVDSEHYIGPEFYNRLYDSITAAIHRVSPHTEFVGLALAQPNLSYFNEFLSPEKHAPDTPLQWISYHFYGEPDTQNMATAAAESYEQANTFFTEVAAVEAIRQKATPWVRTTLDEIGTWLPGGGAVEIVPGYVIPDAYWVWSGGVYAYIVSHMAVMGIDVVGESQLIGYPGQFPAVSLVDWTTGKPTARLRVLELLEQYFKPGIELMQTNTSAEGLLHAQAFVDEQDRENVLLVNKGNQTLEVLLEGAHPGIVRVVDLSSGGGPWRTEHIRGPSVLIPGYATAIVTVEQRQQGWGT